MSNKERFKAVVSTHLLLTQDENILLLLRKNTGYADGQYSVIAGHIDGNESIVEATIREAREEANIVLTPNQIEFGCVMHRKTTDREIIDFFFIANNWEGTIENAEPEKCAGLIFFPKYQLPINVVPYVRSGINCSLDKQNLTEFGW
jgi:8-oxo-dGTP diphosphatase